MAESKTPTPAPQTKPDASYEKMIEKVCKNLREHLASRLRINFARLSR